MPSHTTSVASRSPLALVRLDRAREQSAVAVVEALDDCPASEVSRVLRCSPDLVRRWGRGQGSPTLAQVLASPDRFALRLLAAAGRVYEPPAEVVEVSPRERLLMLLTALGALLGATPHGLDSLEQYGDEELDQRDAALVQIEEQTRRERDAIRRVREARNARAEENKGAR